MRIVTAMFKTGEQFLRAYGQSTLRLATRMELTPGEPVVLDVRLPGLPNPELLRATVQAPVPEGFALAIAPGEEATLDFLVKHAQRPIDRPELVTRQFERFPLELPCAWRVVGRWDKVPSSTTDLSSGGAFVRTADPPPVGTPVVLCLGGSLGRTLGGDEGLELQGRVAWRRATAGEAGMGVDFSQLTGASARRLREILRGSSERGRVALSA
jgi:hypothetical protein